MASTTITTAFLLLFTTTFLAATVVNGRQSKEKKWCVGKQLATKEELQANIDYACGSGIDCEPIKSGGSCYQADNIWAHASYAMNSFYQSKGKLDSQCDFKGTAELTTSDPSTGRCKFLSD